MFARRVLSEAIIGLRRNKVMTAAAVLTVSISLSLLGAALMLRGEVTQMQAYYYTKVEVSVFLTQDVTDQQRQDIRTTLLSVPAVAHVDYESQQEAYRRYVLEFKDQPDLKAATETALPESYRVKLRDPKQYAVVARALQGAPGVDQVVDQKKILDRVFGVLNGLRDAALVASRGVV